MLQKKSKREINKILKTKKGEDFEVIKDLEKILIKKRGYAFKMPKPKSYVVLLLSGGLDSIMVWAYLLKELRLKVLPINFSQNKKFLSMSKAELRSINYFSKKFKKEFPSLFLKPIFLDGFSARSQIRKKFKNSSKISKKFIFENLDQYDNSPLENISMMSSLATSAAFYAQFFYAENLIKINTIFCGVMPRDGETMKSQTFTAIRASMLNLCVNTNDYSWQFSALPIEKEAGFFNKKHEFIEWFEKNGFKINKTWSCNSGKNLVHCGHCYSCYSRKENIKKAGLIDKTFYKTS